MDGLLNEEGCPKKYRMTKKDRAWLEKMRDGANAALKAEELKKSAREMYEAAAALEDWSQGKELSSGQSQKLVKALDFLVDEGEKYLTATEREKAFRLRTKIVKQTDEAEWTKRMEAKKEPPRGHAK